jgi:crotonobetainyl-CoA:carnitine CoA-transferase CaiB-like acyl-CoA transferase
MQCQIGLALINTGPPGQSLRAGASVIDILGAVFPVVAAPAALREREITGKGQRVSSAPFESTAFLMSTHMADMTATGLEARPMPVRRGAWAVYKVFKRCRWPAVHQRHQRPAMDAVCRGIPAAGIGRRSVSWAPVGQSGDLFTDPHLLATGGLVDVFLSRFGGGDGKFTGLPALRVEFGADRQRSGIGRRPPRMGEHNAEVLGEVGFSAAEISWSRGSRGDRRTD